MCGPAAQGTLEETANSYAYSSAFCVEEPYFCMASYFSLAISIRSCTISSARPPTVSSAFLAPFKALSTHSLPISEEMNSSPAGWARSLNLCSSSEVGVYISIPWSFSLARPSLFAS